VGAAFSPDGARAVTASDDNTARLWDAKTGASLAVLQGHTSPVNSAAFSPDGARVVTASWDKTARQWDAKTGASLAVLQGHAGSVTSAASTNNPGAICDRLAGNPFDPQKRAPGVAFGDIETEKAVPACRAAVSAAPDESRYRYELGRALYRANKRDEAEAMIRAAAAKGDPGAQDFLGDLYKYGSDKIVKDNAKALLLYRQAAAAGYAPAFSDVASLYWDGMGTGIDRTEAIRWLNRGIDRGDPYSRQRLAELYEIGNQLPKDLERALFHFAIAARLFEAVGDESGAAVACARRGSLARALPPEDAVRIAHQVADWRPRGP
jgi:TPR repeat protein